MQKHANIVDLVKSFPTNIYLQNLASIQKRTSPVKFAHLAEKSGKGSISNLSTKVRTREHHAVPERQAVRDAVPSSANAVAERQHTDSSRRPVDCLRGGQRELQRDFVAESGRRPSGAAS